jgi:predicted dehydrogenase/threonine dehydrogenase-like Zn-dependent dehydrogenase
MKQVLQARNAAAVVREVPAPPCPPGGVLVRNRYSVISSGTERARVELSQSSLIGKARQRPDLVREVIGRARREGLKATREAVQRRLGEETAVGYSSAGHVIEVGEHVRGLRPGDAVACAGGGHANHADIVSVPGNLCVKVPDGVDLRDAAFGTIAAIALQAVRLADVHLGERVAVVGCGLVGQIVIRLLRCAGAETYAIEIQPDRLEDALRSGANHAITPDHASAEIPSLTDGKGVDSVIVAAAAPSSDPLHLAAKVARDRARVILVGAVPIELPRGPLYDKELTFMVSRSYGPGRYDEEYEERGLDYPIGYVRWTEQRNIECVLGLLARGELRLGDLVEQEYPVDEAAQAYARLVGHSGPPLRGALVLSYGDPERPNGSVSAAEPVRMLSARTSEANQLVNRGLGAQAIVRLGLIGPGSFASRVIVPAFRDAGVVLEAVAGGSGPSAEAATRTVGFRRQLDSAGAVFKDPSVDAVAICTRHGAHAELVMQALSAGKHVFCEKPLALTEPELAGVVDAARASSGVLAVGFNRRFSTLLGEVRSRTMGPAPITAHYRVAAGRLPLSHWAHDLSQGGGRLLGECCHFVDCLRFLAGAPIVSVHATGHGAADLPIQAWDNLAVTLSFEDGSVGTLTYVSDGSGKVGKERLEVFCGASTAVLDDYRSVTLYGGTGSSTIERRTQDKGHTAEIAAFVEAVRSGRPPVSLDEVENVSRATLAAVESLRTGAPVALTTRAGK